MSGTAIALPPPRHPALVRTARAVAECFFSAPGREAPPARLDWVAAELEDVAVHAGARGLWTVRVVAFLLAYLAPLFVRRVGHLASLSLPLRALALARMEASAAAPLVLALKAVLCTVYYEHPEVAAEVGWDGWAPGGVGRVDPEGKAP